MVGVFNWCVLCIGILGSVGGWPVVIFGEHCQLLTGLPIAGCHPLCL